MDRHDRGFDSEALAERLGETARSMEAQLDPDSTYAMATEVAVANVAGCQAAGLTLSRKDGAVESRAATSEAVGVADALQEELREGPCLDAVVRQSVVHSPNLTCDRRWPTWGPRVAQESGLHSVLSLRLFTHGTTVGALNLYSDERDAFTDDDRVDAVTIAAHVCTAIVAARKAHHLETALGSRTVIGQATGMLIERFGLTPEVAFALLVRVASTEQVKLRDLAAELVRTGHLRGVPGERRA